MTGYDFRPMFAEVAPLISAADLALWHMETPISQTGTHLTVGGELVFNTPHEMLDGVKSGGYDGCDFASNHAWDQSLDGLKSTTAAFADAGRATRPNPDPQQPEAVARYDVHGITIAHLAYTYTILNAGSPSTKTPPGAPWLGAAMWPIQGPAGTRCSAPGRQQALSRHGQPARGQEYLSTPTKEQTALAAELLDSPEIDLILGTHVHVVQSCQTVNDKLVFYGLGNSLSNQSSQVDFNLEPQTQDGMIATVTVSRDASGKVTDFATYQPTSVDLNGHVIRLATKTGNPATWNRTVATVGAMEVARPRRRRSRTDPPSAGLRGQRDSAHVVCYGSAGWSDGECSTPLGPSVGLPTGTAPDRDSTDRLVIEVTVGEPVAMWAGSPHGGGSESRRRTSTRHRACSRREG